MPWFRWKNKKDAPAAPESATTEVPEAPAEPEVAAASSTGSAVAPGAETEAQRNKRRRGSRGGRGRKRPTGEGADGDGASSSGSGPASTKQPKEPAREKPERSQRAERNADRRRTGGQGGSTQRRRQPPRRSPLPAAKRELLISIDIGEQRVAIIEDDRVAEVYLERPERRSIAGNIYLGTVDNVLPGMEAAFVEIGLEKNGFLYVDEIVVPELEGKRHGKKIQDLISRGEQLLVQAVKDPMKTKGARLTTEISLPGRFLVYVPNGEGLGVSRRLEDSERARLKDIIKSLDVKEGGVIVRTAAEGASAEDVERDLVFLQRLWKTIQARANGAAAPSLVYQEAELPLRIVRDLFAGDFVSAQVDNERTHKRIVSYLKKTSPHMIERVHRYKEKESLFESSGVEKEIASTLDRRVDLPSGGYLVFDYAEAFTVIDVNTGRFVGSRSKNSNQRLEDTITKNNLEAVKEVVRQLRLRDIGGIIVIDFIDMANPKNRASVEDALRDELERDRTKTYVVEISPLGLVEMTRQNVTDGPREILTRKCPTCAGDGIVVSDHTVAMQIERKLRALAAPGSRVQAYRIALHPRVLELVVGPGGARLAAIEEATRRRFFLVAAEGHIHTDHFSVLAEGKLVDLQPAVNVAEGSTVEIKLGELGRYDATAGAGKLEGLDVLVADAAKLVGKKATVTIGRVLDGQAFATLVVADAGAGPITFESEAEKPTRAPAKRKALVTEGEIREEDSSDEDGSQPDDDAVDAATDVAAAHDVEEGDFQGDATGADEVAEIGDAEEIDADAEPAADGTTPAKKRTRRGSRGGRRRRKPAGAGAAAVGGEDVAADADQETEEAVDDGVAPTQGATGDAQGATTPGRPEPSPGRRRSPRIHVPNDGATKAGASPEVIEDAIADEDATADAGVVDGIAEEPGVDAADGAVAPVKRKTRRGSRGGKNHRKKPAVAAGAGAPADDGVNGAVEIDVERVDDGDAVTAAVEADVIPVSVVPAPEPERDGDEPDEPVAQEDAGYVPMSQWLDDFDRR
ncbi:Rne/Rng family ribonuclease [Gaiella sp.]|uniref:Rne/Rng family ribonuclease n=1 Tax=Gaiella sp. TaxID=2663207 RepID=UPI003982DC60